MKVESILKEIKNGKTFCISTYGHITKINQKTVNKFDKIGRSILKDGKENETGFYISSGRSYNYVIPSGCRLYYEY